VGAPNQILLQSWPRAVARNMSVPKKTAEKFGQHSFCGQARPSLAPARYVAMSLEWIAAGVLVCLFGMIALMPSFDGKWE